jgi:hypothetical protein
MVVLRLVPKSGKETAAVLRALAAEAEANILSGVAICFKRQSGEERVVFTGCYKAPGAAASAAMRISWKMTMAPESGFGP